MSSSAPPSWRWWLLHTAVPIVGCWMVLSTLYNIQSHVNRPSRDLDRPGENNEDFFQYPESLRMLWGNPSSNSFTKEETTASLGMNTDDEFSQDDTCRNYLKQFLNGSTDFSDECTGIYNAYSAAACKQENINNFIFSEEGGQSETNTDNYNTSEVNMIDDFFEAWACCDHIATYYNKHCEQEELDATRLFGIVAVLITCWLAKSLLRVVGCQWIPDAGACVLVGAVVGALLRFFVTSAEEINKRMIFNNNLFLQILLPPIIFEAALSINKRAFRRDLFPILTFAVVGTGISAVAIGYITFYVSKLGGGGVELENGGGGSSIPFLESLLFGALMSSIDPVATLSILLGVGVGQDDTLYTLVFGESLLNDGVSIVLFDSLVRHVGDEDVVGQAAVTEILWHFVLVTFGSMMVGILCGAICTFYFWVMKGQHTAIAEGALFFTWALIPYYVAESLEMSGIISIMVMGFMLDYYVIGGFQDQRAEWSSVSQIDGSVDEHHGIPSHFPYQPDQSRLDRFKSWCEQAFSGKGHMQEHSRSHVGYVAEVISSIVETAIFAYLGLFLFNDNKGVFGLTAAGVFACVSSRAAMVVVLCAVINLFVWVDMEHRLTNLWRMMRGRGDTVLVRQAYEERKFLGAQTQFILFTAGIRGAVSYALVQNIPVYDAVSRHGSIYKGELRAMTSATIVGVLFVFGALTYFGVNRSASGHRRPNQPGNHYNDQLMGHSFGGSGDHHYMDGSVSGYIPEFDSTSTNLSQHLMDEANQLASTEEERERAASLEFDHQQMGHNLPQQPYPQQEQQQQHFIHTEHRIA